MDGVREIKTTIACLGNCGDGPECCGCFNLRELSPGEWLVVCNESGRTCAVGYEGHAPRLVRPVGGEVAD